MNNAEFSTYTLLSYEINKAGQGKEDVINQLKPYVDAESKLVKDFYTSSDPEINSQLFLATDCKSG